MKPQMTLKDGTIGMLAFHPTRRTALERLVLTLMTLGMIASFVVFLSSQQATVTQTNPNELVPRNIIKSQLYYLAHAAEIILLVSAGLIALLSTDFRTVVRGYPVRFLLLLGAALLMMARSYTLSDLLSTKLVDSTGPFPFFISVLVFVGSRRSNWTFLGKVMVLMAVLFSALALLGMAGLQVFTRQEAVISMQNTLNTLYWPASWIVLKHYPEPSLGRRLRFIPVFIYILGSLFTQTRLNFVMVFALFTAYGYLQRRRRVPQASTWIVGLALVAWVGFSTAVLLRDTRAFERIESVADAFASRVDEDTRTGQLVYFFDDVEPHEFLLGRGSFAVWNWGGMPWAGGTDVGYLTLLLYGGVLLLLTYAATHLTPSFTVLRNNAADWQLTAAGVVLLYSIRMFSSEYPGAALGYYPVLFCVGACISTDFSDRDRRVLA
jgi:hypothetical protein